jgi:uncharacterized protein YqkB
MDYYINDKNTLSVYTNQNKVNSDNNIDVNIMNQMLMKYHTKIESDNSDGTYNLAFKHLTKKEGETLDLKSITVYIQKKKSYFRPFLMI